MRLKNKIAWITGASRGVGEGIARVFHREGADIIISARGETELNRVKDSCTDGPGTVTVLPFDIAEMDQLADAADTVLADFDRLDVLVNTLFPGVQALGAPSRLPLLEPRIACQRRHRGGERQADRDVLIAEPAALVDHAEDEHEQGDQQCRRGQAETDPQGSASTARAARAVDVGFRIATGGKQKYM